ncbi:unnamed protein product [Cuscuta epithymum]|uniref:Uncharacterized protein n=1 Tax=Cuscuta epithymum TaxID=186058 RepID=A0AAV0FJM5_9ASTE|nr:unnamed protein product [Cuscuta epithymum]
MNATPFVFDPGGTPAVCRFMEGEKLNSNKVVEGLARVIWSPQVVEEEDDMRKLRPRPELPPWRSCASRVCKNVLLIITRYFQSNDFFPFFLCFVVSFILEVVIPCLGKGTGSSAKYYAVGCLGIFLVSYNWFKPDTRLAIRVAPSWVTVSMSIRKVDFRCGWRIVVVSGLYVFDLTILFLMILI